MKIIIADDHPIFRKGLQEILSSNSDFEVIDACENGLDAYQSILSNRPDLAILDLEMPGLTGLDVARKVMNEKSETKFIILTMHREKTFFSDAMQIGVDGYVLKDFAIEELMECIESVVSGKKYVSPGISKKLTEKNITIVPNIELLTATERIIIKLISEGNTTQEISDFLFISSNTVDNHRSNMVKKLELEGKNALMKFAIEFKGWM